MIGTRMICLWTQTGARDLECSFATRRKVADQIRENLVTVQSTTSNLKEASAGVNRYCVHV